MLHHILAQVSIHLNQKKRLAWPGLMLCAHVMSLSCQSVSLFPVGFGIHHQIQIAWSLGFQQFLHDHSVFNSFFNSMV